ncbi:MAG: ABC-F family ATP-binding cassette domain-containing protein [Armatimonadota bacterium]
MAIISLNGVSKSFGAYQILDEVSFTLGASEKIALVGPNGSGKTTILRMITDQDTPDIGTVNVLPGTTIGLMTQDTELNGGGTLLEEVSNASTEVWSLEREMRRLETAMSASEGDELNELLMEYGETQHEFDRLGGYTFEADVKSTLSGLGLGPEHWEKPVDILSGGMKTRAALAKLLLQKPDVLLLDEPTNHLDIDACEWLEEFLQEFPGAVLVVSHDRYFLDRVANKIIDLHERCTRTYPGNYTSFTKQKEEFLRQRLESFERQQQEIAKLEDFINRYRVGQRHQEAKSRAKRLEKMVRIRKPRLENAKMRLNIEKAQTSGNIVMDLQGVGKAFDGKTLFAGLDLIVESKDRIGLVGPNGAGKTTLLRMIIGDEEPTSGTLSIGYSVDIGYFAQDLGELDPSNTVLEELLEWEDLTLGEARSFLAKFLFRGDDVYKAIPALSGGERNRLILAKLMLTKPNVLVLDEPTNHLDIDSRQALDQALRDFDGTVILVSHDRYLLNSVATRMVEISNGKAVVYNGNYDFFVERAKLRKPKAVKKKPKPIAKKTANGASRPSGPKPAEIEKAIEEAEKRSQELTEILGNPDVYADAEYSASMVAEYQELQSRIEDLYEQWESLIE